MATTPVSQASFDTALTQFVTLFNTMITTGQGVATGLATVEASLLAAQASTGSDFTNELAIVQGLSTQFTNDTAAAQALIAGFRRGEIGRRCQCAHA